MAKASFRMAIFSVLLLVGLLPRPVEGQKIPPDPSALAETKSLMQMLQELPSQIAESVGEIAQEARALQTDFRAMEEREHYKACGTCSHRAEFNHIGYREQSEELAERADSVLKEIAAWREEATEKLTAYRSGEVSQWDLHDFLYSFEGRVLWYGRYSWTYWNLELWLAKLRWHAWIDHPYHIDDWIEREETRRRYGDLYERYDRGEISNAELIAAQQRVDALQYQDAKDMYDRHAAKYEQLVGSLLSREERMLEWLREIRARAQADGNTRLEDDQRDVYEATSSWLDENTMPVYYSLPCCYVGAYRDRQVPSLPRPDPISRPERHFIEREPEPKVGEVIITTVDYPFSALETIGFGESFRVEVVFELPPSDHEFEVTVTSPSAEIRVVTTRQPENLRVFRSLPIRVREAAE